MSKQRPDEDDILIEALVVDDTTRLSLPPSQAPSLEASRVVQRLERRLRKLKRGLTLP